MRKSKIKLLDRKREAILTPKYSATKVSKDLIESFRYADDVLFVYEEGFLEIFFIKAPTSSDAQGTMTSIQGITTDFDFFHEDLETDISLCELELRNSNVNWEFQTFVGALEPGDELEFIWKVDRETTTDLMIKGFGADTLTAIIYKPKDKQQHFIIATKVGSENLGTRMVRNAKPVEIKHMLCKNL